MKKRILVLLSVMLCFMLGACSAGSTVIVDCNDFTINCPRSWNMKVVENATPGEPIAQIHLPEVDNYTSNIVVTAMAVAGLKADDFTEDYARDLVETSSESTGVTFTLDSCEHITLGSRAAVIIRYSGEKDGHNIVISEQLIPMPDMLYRLTFNRLNDVDAEPMDSAMASVAFK